ncbi:hypothetical protein BJ165DRAFT_734422 [Panaeolus papilionaceus]|nr:hypothetical protein BJ165DRAFT_734422 [Panaeolus papilionaceus]
MSQRLLNKDDLYFPVGVFFECVFFGLYTPLFVKGLLLWRKRRSRTFSSWVNLSLLTAMWVVSSIHIVISILRFLRIFIRELNADSADTYARLLDATKFDNAAHMILAAIMIWLGDILAIYRTYIVWSRNIWVVALPILLDVANIVVNSMTLYWFTHPNLVSFRVKYAWYMPVFPLIFTQNVITTGLLSYKIWAQHRQSVAHGVRLSDGSLTLGYIARMIIETGMMYTLQLLITIILLTVRHPAVLMVISGMVPTIGTVFVLMNIRVHYGGRNNIDRPEGLSQHLPTWLDGTYEGNIEHTRSSSITTAQVDRARSAIGSQLSLPIPRSKDAVQDKSFLMDTISSEDADRK